MSVLPDEKGRLLRAAKKIHSYKLVQVMGYGALRDKAKDERISHLLNRIKEEEERIAEFWSERIRELGGTVAERSLLRNWKQYLLWSILGTKGFFEWAVVGEEEGIENLAIQAEKIKDTSTSETWCRFASDERRHLEMIKTEVLGMEAWDIRGGSGVRDMASIFSGSYGGLLSTLAAITGVVGAIMDSKIVLVSGIAGLIAGAISSFAGTYQAARTEVEVLVTEAHRDVVEGRRHQEERDKLIEFYQSQGYTRGEAEALVNRLEEKETPFQAGTFEELGLAPKEIGSPVRAGFLSGGSFGIASLVPLVPFAFKSLGIMDATLIAIVATVACLFLIGAVRTIFTRKHWVRSGVGLVIFGAAAASVTYVIGKAFSFLL
jgi:predicted membrane protein (TIGR00267 family)